MSLTNEMLSRRIDTLEKQIAMLLKDSSDKTTTIMESSQQDRQRDSHSHSHLRDKPTKKRTSGYLLYSSENREAVKTKLTADGTKLKNQDIMTELGAMWQALSDEERAEWNAKAKQTNLGRGRKTKHIKKQNIKGTRARTRSRRH